MPRPKKTYVPQGATEPLFLFLTHDGRVVPLAERHAFDQFKSMKEYLGFVEGDESLIRSLDVDQFEVIEGAREPVLDKNGDPVKDEQGNITFSPVTRNIGRETIGKKWKEIEKMIRKMNLPKVAPQDRRKKMMNLSGATRPYNF